jgi:hypothetical protein
MATGLGERNAISQARLSLSQRDGRQALIESFPAGEIKIWLEDWQHSCFLLNNCFHSSPLKQGKAIGFRPVFFSSF